MHWPEKLSNEYYQRLYRFQDEILAFAEKSGPVFYLGGGTALSRIYYQHRYSDDLDFFTFDDINFVQHVQELHEKLEGQGYRVSIFSLSQTFARLSLEARKAHPGIPLKCDFILTRKDSHVGDFKKTPIFSRADNPGNILAEKLSFLHKKSPKDIADIWIICRHLPFNWGEAISQANQKRTTDPLYAAEILRSFPAGELENVRWIIPFKIEHFERDSEIMVQDIITREDNSLNKKGE